MPIAPHMWVSQYLLSDHKTSLFILTFILKIWFRLVWPRFWPNITCAKSSYTKIGHKHVCHILPCGCHIARSLDTWIATSTCDCHIIYCIAMCLAMGLTFCWCTYLLLPFSLYSSMPLLLFSCFETIKAKLDLVTWSSDTMALSFAITQNNLRASIQLIILCEVFSHSLGRKDCHTRGEHRRISGEHWGIARRCIQILTGGMYRIESSEIWLLHSL